MNHCKIKNRSINYLVLTMAVIAATPVLVLGITVSGNAAEQVTMTTGQGKVMTLTMQTLTDSRGYQYCELVFNDGDVGNDIYSTSIGRVSA